MNKKIVLILGLIVLLFSCKTDYGNDLRYCYLNSDNTQYASAEREYKDLLNLPIKTRIESTFRIDSIRLDTLNEITSESLRLKLFNNFIINGFYWFDSSIKLDQLVHPSTPRLKYEEYINQENVSNYRFSIQSRIDLYSNINSILVSIYRNDFKTGLDIVLLNIDNSGQLISTITLARNIDFSDGLSGGTERINSKIYFRKYIYLKYKSGIQALDIPGSDPFERKFSLLLRIDKTGKIY